MRDQLLEPLELKEEIYYVCTCIYSATSPNLEHIYTHVHRPVYQVYKPV